MFDIEKIKNKAKLVGADIVSNNWAVAILNNHNRYEIVTRSGKIDGTFKDIQMHEYFIVCDESSTDINGYVVCKRLRVYTANSNKTVLPRCRIINVSVPSPYNMAPTRGDGQYRFGDVALIRSMSANYLVSSTGKTLKVTSLASYIALNKVGEQEYIKIYGTIFGSSALGWVSKDFKTVSDKNILA